MGHTRVNLRHLLEDLRDAYPYPIEEAVLTELVANALDSGAATISIAVRFDPPRLEFVDDGAGMKRTELERYHDIAATGKQRGQGIGFAGVGAKLSLLICREVVTETRRGGFHGATRWWLERDTLAPWEEVSPPGLVRGGHGTAVLLYLEDLASPLLDPERLRRMVVDHYEPLFDPDLSRFLFLYYPGGVRVTVDGRPVSRGEERGEVRFGEVRGGRRKVLGAVKLEVATEPVPEGRRGVAVSVLGKVVKRGWEWLGVTPEHPDLVRGLAELPELVALLTLNKADFLRDAASLQRFYAVRKRVQGAVAELLAELGELPGRRPRPRDLRPVEREVGLVLDRILERFPELEPLLERRRGWERVTGLVEGEEGQLGVAGDGGRPVQPELPGLEGGAGGDEVVLPPPEEGVRPDPEGDTRGEPVRTHRRRPGLRLAWVEEPARADELAWLEGTLLALNRAHPAWERARGPAAERLLVITAIATALAGELEPGHEPVRFVSQFLARWARPEGSAGGEGG